MAVFKFFHRQQVKKKQRKKTVCRVMKSPRQDSYCFNFSRLYNFSLPLYLLFENVVFDQLVSVVKILIKTCNAIFWSPNITFGTNHLQLKSCTASPLVSKISPVFCGTGVKVLLWTNVRISWLTNSVGSKVVGLKEIPEYCWGSINPF